MSASRAVGYSGTPLAKKLGIKASSRILVLNAPDGVASLLEPTPPGAVVEQKAGPRVDMAQVFVTLSKDLAKHLSALRRALYAEAAVWVCWPKKSAKGPATVTEDIIRELAIPLGYVDIKVCAVSDVWSGLKQGVALRKSP